MIYTDKIIREINELFKDDIKTKEKLLNYDVKAIHELALRNDIDPLEVINSIKNAKSLDDLDVLYKNALFKYRKKKLYFEIVELPNKRKLSYKSN